MIQKISGVSDWLTLKEAAELTKKHPNTIINHRARITHKRSGYGKRAPLMFSRKSLLRWMKAYSFIRSSNGQGS